MQELRASRWAGLAAMLIVVGAVTLVLYPLQELDPGVSSGVLYVLGVLLVSLTWGLRLGLATSVLSALALWLLHTDPAAGLTAVEAEDVAAISVLLITSVVAALIADRARMRVEDAEQRLALEAELHASEIERARLEEIRTSRARVMAAGDEERKQVVRDLHDGAQQRLVHTVITLKLAGRALARDEPQEGAALVEEGLGHAEAAITELRELAHGILPAALSRGGLPAGLDALAERMPIPVDVEVDDERLPSVVEATAYFVVAEALTNVAKHAGATRAVARAAREDGALVVTVEDDGRGGASEAGPGLTGLRDRLAVLEGALAITERQGGGTRVTARIPVAFPA